MNGVRVCDDRYEDVAQEADFGISDAAGACARNDAVAATRFVATDNTAERDGKRSGARISLRSSFRSDAGHVGSRDVHGCNRSKRVRARGEDQKSFVPAALLLLLRSPRG